MHSVLRHERVHDLEIGLIQVAVVGHGRLAYLLLVLSLRKEDKVVRVNDAAMARVAPRPFAIRPWDGSQYESVGPQHSREVRELRKEELEITGTSLMFEHVICVNLVKAVVLEG